MRILKRVFICSRRSLFSSGIKHLLDAEPELEVVGWEADVEEASKGIQAMEPDAILIVAEGSSECLMSQRQCFLRAEGKTRIIEMSLQDRKVYVYTAEQLTIKEVGDLVRVIEGPVTVVPKRPCRGAGSGQPKEKYRY